MDWRLRTQRRKVIHEPGHAHELTFTCYHRFKFLVADRTCQWLAEAINQARTRFNFALWAYVFMPEHVHMIVHPRQPVFDLPGILRAIKEPAGRKGVKHLEAHAPKWLQRITVQRGNCVERRFWQAGGGYDRNISEAKTLFSMIEYLHLNPVRRGLVAQATDWKWSSAGWFAGNAQNSLAPDVIESVLLDA